MKNNTYYLSSLCEAVMHKKGQNSVPSGELLLFCQAYTIQGHGAAHGKVQDLADLELKTMEH